jgi:salicylate 5-hydroxylase small subunit
MSATPTGAGSTGAASAAAASADAASSASASPAAAATAAATVASASVDGRSAGQARGQVVEPALRAELDALYADYAAALDEARFDDWVALFAEDCRYVLQPRENFERGLPLATLDLESRGMLRDRVYGITRTLFHAPYYQRHVIGPLRIVAIDRTRGALSVDVHAPYAVHRTKVHDASEVFNVGRYLDRVVRDPADGLLRFARKHAVFDSETIPNSIIYPI